MTDTPTDSSLSKVSLGKFGSFLADKLEGEPFGLTYEIVDGGGSKVIEPQAYEDVGERLFLSNIYSNIYLLLEIKIRTEYKFENILLL